MCLLLKLSVITPEYNGDESLNIGKALNARLHNALKAKKYYKTTPAMANYLVATLLHTYLLLNTMYNYWRIFAA